MTKRFSAFTASFLALAFIGTLGTTLFSASAHATGALDNEIQYGNDQALFVQCAVDPNSSQEGEVTVTVKAWFLIGPKP